MSNISRRDYLRNSYCRFIKTRWVRRLQSCFSKSEELLIVNRAAIKWFHKSALFEICSVVISGCHQTMLTVGNFSGRLVVFTSRSSTFHIGDKLWILVSSQHIPCYYMEDKLEHSWAWVRARQTFNNCARSVTQISGGLLMSGDRETAKRLMILVLQTIIKFCIQHLFTKCNKCSNSEHFCQDTAKVQWKDTAGFTAAAHILAVGFMYSYAA